ncbi:condensin complex subunit 2, partial [Tanacetum coccineum]
MTETLTPNPNPNPIPGKQRPPLLSPPNNKFFIGSNDDKLERAQARAARAALFRRKPASCTLEAGVKIYAMRVDSVHAEAYRVLGGINRVGLDLEQ